MSNIAEVKGDNFMSYFGEHPGLAVMVTTIATLMGIFDDISAVVKLLASIGAFVVVVLTIISKSQEIRLNKRKLDGKA